MVVAANQAVYLEKLNPYYDEAGNLLNFTRQERVVIYFLIITLGVGAILRYVRNQRLDQQLISKRFHQEESQFKDVAEQINSGHIELVDSSFSISDSSTQAEVKAIIGKVNINTAELSELSLLPGIGPAIAGRIRAYTDQNGPFKNKSEIILVKGIGKKIYARIEGLVTTE